MRLRAGTHVLVAKTLVVPFDEWLGPWKHSQLRFSERRGIEQRFCMLKCSLKEI